MRSLIKNTYFNRPKTSKTPTQPSRHPHRQNNNNRYLQGSNVLDRIYKRQLADALKGLIVNIIEMIKEEMNTIHKFSKYHSNRILLKTFKAWKQQSQQPQPFQNLSPIPPPVFIPNDTKLFVSLASASEKLTKSLSKSPLKKKQLKFYTPAKTQRSPARVCKTEISKPFLRQNSFETLNQQKAILFRKRCIWKAWCSFQKFQRHKHFQAVHFRNFYLLREVFNQIKSNQTRIQGTFDIQIVFLRRKDILTMRVCFSKLYYFSEQQKNQ